MYIGVFLAVSLIIFIKIRVKKIAEIRAYLVKQYPEIEARLTRDKMKIGANQAFVGAMEESLKYGELNKKADPTLDNYLKQLRTFEIIYLAVTAVIFILFNFF